METRTKTASKSDKIQLFGLCETMEPADWQRFPAQFRKQIRLDANRCWTWTGSYRIRYYKDTRYRYGSYCNKLVHRMAYMLLVGPIPAHLEIDHLCHNKLCLNPAHLEAVTHQQNCARRPKSGPASKRRAQ